jgi:EAL domain-containing protein (putative c-di-GMP-specific phosphodiesterase class I)
MVQALEGMSQGGRGADAKAPVEEERKRGKVLLVDDEPTVLRSLSRHLGAAGYEVHTCSEGPVAVRRLRMEGFDVVVSDIAMPDTNGIELLRAVRQHDPHLPVVLVTGTPVVESAIEAVQHGAFGYLLKPVNTQELLSTIARAVQLNRLARAKHDALTALGTATGGDADRVGLETTFNRALESLWIAFQPIVRASDHSVFGYEALLRCREPTLPHPGAVLDAAERLNELQRLGQIARERASQPMLDRGGEQTLFVNLHPEDLLDPTLLLPDAPISRLASRVVLEITERSSLEKIPDVRGRVRSLRERGFRIAVDDLGAGYAGLSSFAQLEPDIVKLDMSLVRDVNDNPIKRKLVRSMTSLCQDMGLMIVAEGVETPAERDTLVELGCDLLQGYQFARPGVAFPQAEW